MEICRNCGHHKSYHQTMTEASIPCTYTNLGQYCGCFYYVPATETNPYIGNKDMKELHEESKLPQEKIGTCNRGGYSKTFLEHEHKIELFERILCAMLPSMSENDTLLADAVSLTEAAIKKEEEL